MVFRVEQEAPVLSFTIVNLLNCHEQKGIESLEPNILLHITMIKGKKKFFIMFVSETGKQESVFGSTNGQIKKN